MNASLKATTLAAIVESAQQIVQALADDLKNDAETMRNGAGPDGISIAEVANFAVGSLLPAEKVAADILAILAAARAIQSVRS